MLSGYVSLSILISRLFLLNGQNKKHEKERGKNNTRGRRPNDEMNNKNEHEMLQVENKTQRLIRFPIIPKPKIGKLA
jgi:hypothetical protein